MQGKIIITLPSDNQDFKLEFLDADKNTIIEINEIQDSRLGVYTRNIMRLLKGCLQHDINISQHGIEIVDSLMALE